MSNNDQVKPTSALIAIIIIFVTVIMAFFLFVSLDDNDNTDEDLYREVKSDPSN